YLIGNDAAQWRTGISLFSKVKVDAVYPGIDLVYYADHAARLEYDFILHPGARVDQISFRIEGADKMRINRKGELVLKIGAEEIRQHAPVIYQNVNGSRKAVDGGYRLLGRDVVAFWAGEYDRNLALIIDPVVSFSTYLGGSKTENGLAIATDSS